MSKQATMARAVICDPKRRAIHEPLYDVDQHTGASVEVFYADSVLARSFGASGPGWYWWTWQRGCLPDNVPAGPFGSSHLAYRDFTTRCSKLFNGQAADFHGQKITERLPNKPLLIMCQACDMDAPLHDTTR
jgi:hypothetical protein